MRTPEDAAKPIQEFYWTFNINGEEEIITTDGSYPNVEGDFVSVDSKIIEEGYQPPISDFSIETEEEDLTEQLLNEEHLIIIVSYSLETIEFAGAERLKSTTDLAIKRGYTVIGLTASGEEAKQAFKSRYNLDFDFYLCDEKALKTVVRSNPGILELQKGTVMQKLHWNDIDDLELPEVERKVESFEERNKDNILYLIDGRISTKEEVDILEKKDTIKKLNFTIQKEVLDSLNKARNTNYVGFMTVELND